MKLVAKFALQACILAFVFITVNGCEGWVAPSDADSKDSRTPVKQLRVAAMKHPLVFNQRRTLLSGYEHDLLEQFARDRKYEIKWVPVKTEDEALNKVLMGEADLAAARLSENHPQKKSFLLSVAYDEQRLNLTCTPETELDLTLTGNLSRDIKMELGVLAKSLSSEQVSRLRKIYPQINLTLVHSSRASVLLKSLSRRQFHCILIDPWEQEVYSAFYPSLKPRTTFSDGISYHFFMRPQLEETRSEMTMWFQKSARQGKISTLRARYEHPYRTLSDYDRWHLFRSLKTRFKTYQGHFKKYSSQFKLPWQLVAAVAYQESHWYEDARSFTGVRGLMQLTRETATHLGVDDRTDPAQSVWGGSKYLRYLINSQPKHIPQRERLSLALATYNVGPAHMIDAQNLAVTLGKNPFAWSDMKEVLPLLANPDYLPLLRYGAARGQEPVDFVHRVLAFYEILSLSI